MPIVITEVYLAFLAAGLSEAKATEAAAAITRALQRQPGESLFTAAASSLQAHPGPLEGLLRRIDKTTWLLAANLAVTILQLLTILLSS